MKRLLSIFFILPQTLLAASLTVPEMKQIIRHKDANFEIKSVIKRTVKDKDFEAFLVKGYSNDRAACAVLEGKTSRLLEVSIDGELIYDGKEITINAHRGGSHAPENTIPAFEGAIERGATYIEMDVRYTEDGHYILYHDPIVGRTSNGWGRVSKYTLAEIKELDAGSWYSKKYKGTKVPTFEEALDAIGDRAIVDIDLKAGPIGPLLEILRQRKKEGDPAMTFFSYTTDYYKEIAKTDIDLLIRPEFGFTSKVEEFEEKYNPPIYNVSHRRLSRSLAKRIHLRGKKVFGAALFAIRDKNAARKVIKNGADILQVDDIQMAHEVLAEYYEDLKLFPSCVN